MPARARRLQHRHALLARDPLVGAPRPEREDRDLEARRAERAAGEGAHGARSTRETAPAPTAARRRALAPRLRMKSRSERRLR